MLRRLSFLALLLVAAAISATAPATLCQENMATVHGDIYELWSFSLLENVTIKVYSDSTFQQQIFATDGTYSLTLPPGSYTITAKYYHGTTLLYDAEESVTLSGNENKTLDLIMFPTFEENELPENYDNPLEEEEAVTRTVWWFVLGAALALAIVGAGAFYYLKILPKKRSPAEEIRALPPARVVGLPEDLSEVLNVVRESGGRINQVELRQKLPYSEAKVSLMISDLEDRGLVRKIQKGRGNIIELTESEK